MRTATLPANYDHSGASNGRDHLGDHSPPPQPGLMRGRTFESAFQNLSLEQSHRRAQWQSHLGWDDVPKVNESRRHSLADIPTRRGSLAAGEPSHLSRAFTHDDIEEEQTHYHPNFALDRTRDTANDTMRAQESGAANIIPLMYRVPHVQLTDNEQSEIDARRGGAQAAVANVQWGPGGTGRPRKQLYVVSFKCSRVDVFYLLDNTGLHIREGDMVIVEADRGQDLGTVQHAKVTPDAARLLKKKYSEEQYKWLMMYSRNKDGGFNPNAQFHGESGGTSNNLFPDAPPTMQGSIPRDNYNNLKPKAIKRLANDHEIKMLAEKEGNEAKAKRTCQQKVAHLRLQMEILDAEWQWDFQKLIFYYYADHYINFKDLITELYRIYKTRIWLSAINPASFSQHAMGQPPTGIGPGAVGPYNPYAVNNNYTMAYGEDRDPYGAQMPYRIPYDTYNPNYPAIPGVANSFAPSFGGQNFMFYGQGGPQAQEVAEAPTPTTEPNPPTPLTGAMTDYNFFYDRTGNNEHHALDRMHPELALRQSLANNGQAVDRMNSTFGLLSMGDNSWNTRYGAANNGNMGQQAPIGTARPTSQGNNDYGVPTDEQRQHANLDFRTTQFRNLDPEQRVYTRQSVLNDSANPNSEGSRSADLMLDRLRRMDGGKAEQVASRVQNVDRYLATLPTPESLLEEQ
ncbi:hypothetical protein M409DRAFT_65010 [Zasmidium cellare ATCC 36951]|uniref:PSP1 C-terminal domain-containing protein n=1 Tax=Zasmidium cellare ATCC 36951 TaxID=1080233 RepID=A0A6A6CSY1_ZASCE|nr:uncharacterized protein M409DRAFT_65010 [Zasmidium cellare ATCC 36951]KAF2169298.1 hypothetical protein M409DRAFT_65010 [Zasmidium cellare ATCC 36951]